MAIGRTGKAGVAAGVCGLRPRCSPRLGFPRRRWKRPRAGLLPQNAWQSEERGMGCGPQADRFASGTGEGRTGIPGDPLRTLTTVARRQFGPRLGGQKISRMAAGLRDRWLLEQGDFPLLAPPGAGRRIPGSVRVNDSAVVAERLMAQGQFELRTVGRAEVTGDGETGRKAGRSPSPREVPGQESVLERRTARRPTGEGLAVFAHRRGVPDDPGHASQRCCGQG